MEWIKVTDRLPDKDMRCLVFDKYEGVLVRPFSHYHNCWADEDGDDCYTESAGGLISHWAELPHKPEQI